MPKSLLAALTCAMALSAASAFAADRLMPEDPQRIAALRAALATAEGASEPEFRALAAKLRRDPLWPWIEHQHLRAGKVSRRMDAIEDFLARHTEAPAAESLRRVTLFALAKEGDWAGFRRLGPIDRSEADATLRCHGLTARLARGDDAEVVEDALREWDRGVDLPTACDPAIAALRRIGKLDEARVLSRIEAAAGHGHAGLMRHLARPLAPPLRARIEAEAGFIDTPAVDALGQDTASPRTRAAVEAGLRALARRDPGAAESLLDVLAPKLSLELDRIGRLRAAIALWSAANYLPEAADRFARVPAAAFDERLHEWRVREAIARRDAPAALKALRTMPDGLRQRARWQLIEARLLAHAGARTEAEQRLRRAATEANFHGFLAADLAGLDYPLCPRSPAAGDTAQRALLAAGIANALDLHSLGQHGWAHREWQSATARLSPEQQALAVEAALQRGWYDRASNTLGNGENLRFYAQRFPFPHRLALRREARRHDLPPTWIAGLIRAESSWMSGARSPADARGLMQLLPSTGRDTARRLGRPLGNARALYRPDVNIELGTAYLRQMLDAHEGKPALATAAYNAGPAAVGRWLSERPLVPPLLDDLVLWLETIPYHETRDYVARVMAFSLIYDWRSDAQAGSLWARLHGGDEGRPRRFACTAP